MTISRLDRVLIFGDKLSFLIPHEWEEELTRARTDLVGNAEFKPEANSESNWKQQVPRLRRTIRIRGCYCSARNDN